MALLQTPGFPPTCITSLPFGHQPPWRWVLPLAKWHLCPLLVWHQHCHAGALGYQERNQLLPPATQTPLLCEPPPARNAKPRLSRFHSGGIVWRWNEWSRQRVSPRCWCPRSSWGRARCLRGWRMLFLMGAAPRRCRRRAAAQTSPAKSLLSETAHFICSGVFSRNLSVLRNVRGSRQDEGRALGGRKHKVPVLSLFCHKEGQFICTTQFNLHPKSSLTVCLPHPWLCVSKAHCILIFHLIYSCPLMLTLLFNLNTTTLSLMICIYRTITHTASLYVAHPHERPLVGARLRSLTTPVTVFCPCNF